MSLDEMLTAFTSSRDHLQRNSLAIKLADTGSDQAFAALAHAAANEAITHKGTLIYALSLFIHRPDLFDATIIALLRRLAAEAPTMEARTEAAALVRMVGGTSTTPIGNPCEWR